MSILERIENLQKKPESYRRKVLIAIMVIVVPVILSIWVFTLDLPSSNNNERKVEVQAPFALVSESFTDTYSVFKDKLLSLKSINN